MIIKNKKTHPLRDTHRNGMNFLFEDSGYPQSVLDGQKGHGPGARSHVGPGRQRQGVEDDLRSRVVQAKTGEILPKIVEEVKIRIGG